MSTTSSVEYSNFARKQLEKFGWKDGKGLGKHEDGISSPLQPKRKTNNLGVGFDIGEEFKSTWWQQNFNKIASAIVVENTSDGVQFKKQSKKKKLKETNSVDQYPNFVVEKVVVHEDSDHQKQTELTQTNEDVLFKSQTRLKFKTARFGHKKSAKLIRLQEQEFKALGKKR